VKQSEASKVIYIHPSAPAKPRFGAECNGCGVCCISEPCPIGMIVSGRRHGACSALRWSDDSRRYVCGLLQSKPAPHFAPWIAPLMRLGTALWKRWIHRTIAAGAGCDCDLETSAAPDSLHTK
jgi:hypothetical protein